MLYAAGNAGPGAQTVGSPGTAKNVLTVGASENNRPDQGDDADNPNTMASFSSRGPTADGRLKPDVVAPGTWILSVRAAQAPDGSFWAPFNQDYAYMGGTSMATPLSAGGAAIVREWLNKARSIADPSAALLKAIIVNGATQLPGEQLASNNSGYGRLDLKNTLNANYVMMDDHVQGLQTGGTVTYTVQVVAAGSQGTLVATGCAATRRGGCPAGRSDAGEYAAAGRRGDRSHDAGRTARPGGARLQRGPAAHTYSRCPRPGRAREQEQPAAAPQHGAGPRQWPAAAYQWRHAWYLPAQERRHRPHAAKLSAGDGRRRRFRRPGMDEHLEPCLAGQRRAGAHRRSRLRRRGQLLDVAGRTINDGTASQDTLFYPVQFPAAIDDALTSGIAFAVGIVDEDAGADYLCVALIYASGNYIGRTARQSRVHRRKRRLELLP